MQFLFPIEIDENNPAKLKAGLAQVARLAFVYKYSRETLSEIVVGLDNKCREFVLKHYDLLISEKERNMQRLNSKFEQVKQPLNDAPLTKSRAYDRIGIVPLEQVFDNMGGVIVVAGKEVSVRSKRYKCYARNGVKCVRCGIEGSYFAAERARDTVMVQVVNPKYHLNLYHKTESGGEIMLTVDHILPRSRGGMDVVENMQPMCVICNTAKGNLTEEELKAGITKSELSKHLGHNGWGNEKKPLTPPTECARMCVEK